MSEQGTTKKLFKIGYSDHIVEVEMTKRTACFVTYVDARFGLRREYREAADNFFDTWEEANQYLIADLERKIGYRKDELQRLRSQLGQLKSRKGHDRPTD